MRPRALGTSSRAQPAPAWPTQDISPQLLEWPQHRRAAVGRKIHGRADGPWATSMESASPRCPWRPGAGLLRGEGQQEPSPGRAASQDWIHGSHPALLSRRHCPTLTPKNASHMGSDRSIYCKRGEVPAWLWEKGAGGRCSLCCIL